MTRIQKNILWQKSLVSREMRQSEQGHVSFIIWFTGLSGSGKSTLAHELEALLHKDGYRAYVLDGDNVRHGLCDDLGFSMAARQENLRRVAEVNRLFIDAGVITINAFVSPFIEDREKIRDSVSAGEFIEIYCDANLETCESRDVKGIYKKARAGKIADFTGISSPYEPPPTPEISLKTAEWSIQDCLNKINSYLIETKKLALNKP